MSLVRKVVTLALGEGAARALGVVVYVVIARALGVEGFGVFSFAMGTALLASVVIDMGQNPHLGRTVSRGGADESHVFARVTVNKLLSGTVIVMAVFAGMTLFDLPETTVYATVLMIVWGMVLTVLDGMRALLRALGRMGADSLINALESTGRLVAVLISAWLGAGVVGFTVAFVAEITVAVVLVTALISRSVRLLPTAAEWAANASFAKEAVGLGLVNIASSGFYRLDQVFVLPLAGEAASGLYGAAARVVFTATVVSTLITQAAYPALVRASSDDAAFRAEMRRALALAVGAAALISVSIMVLAEPILSLLYGPEYLEAAVVMRVLSGVILFNAVTAVSMHSASAQHRERLVLPRILTLTILTVIANVLLIPRYGALACAWISVVGEVFLAGSMLLISRDRLLPQRPAPAEG
ncbi:MAG: flippase [Coriobacteriia bacterium]|nr:flippase [Coriobacteriia bacterium]MBN2840206.1 flippase [Coriobacteriia bacterium]